MADDEAPTPPNIVFILADDLGYGDIGAFNPESRIPTPTLDRLAAEGVRLTDVHSATFCCPSRYQFLTGEYRFRNGREGNEAYLYPGQPTVASLLREAGYRTAMLGKWHVGFAELGLHPDPPEGTEAVPGGPVEFGFESYFGIPASLDISPYFFIEGDRVVDFPSERIEENHSPGVRWPQGRFWRGGGLAPGYRHEAVVPELTDRAVAYIEQQRAASEPFFLYFALPAPHAPWVPTEEFQGRSGAGEYGDFVMQVDDVVRRVLEALERVGEAERTLVVFTSDNGPTWYEEDVERYAHRSSGDWRGMKRDAWEGGNRMPFIARWPERIEPGSSSSALVSFTDMLATFVGVGGGVVPESAAVDSLDVLPVLTGRAGSPVRAEVVIEGDDDLAIRRGDWKLIPWLSERSTFDVVFPRGGGVAPPAGPDEPVPGGPLGRLYDLATDPAERTNVYLDHPEIVAELSALLDRARARAPVADRISAPRTTDDGVML